MVVPHINTKSVPNVSAHPSPPAIDDPLLKPQMPMIDRLSPPCEDGKTISAQPPASFPPSPPSEHPPSPAPTEGEAASLAAVRQSTPSPILAPCQSSPSSKPALTSAEAKACRQLLSSVQRHHAAWPFLQPVDPVAAGAPDYFNVIKRPMDLSTIEKKLASQEYEAIQAFADDFLLMIDNCCIYNPPAHAVHQLAKSLGNYIALQLNKMFPALDLSVDQGAEGVRRPKRDIKRPQVFEPEEIHVKKSGGRRGSVRNDDDEEGGARSKAGKKRRASHVDDSSDDDDEKDERIKMLAASIQQIHNTLATLRRKSSTTPSTSKKAKREPSTPSATPAAKKRRQSKAESVPETPLRQSPVPMEQDTIVAVEYVPVVAAAAGPERQCEYCGAVETPMWRRGPSGKSTLCNKCGVKWRSGKIMTENGPPPVLREVREGRVTKPKAKKGKALPPPPPRQITYEQKKELSTLIGTLPERHMVGVVDIIRSGIPHLRDTTDEIELDIDSIDNTTLTTLYDFVMKACGRGSASISFARKPSLKQKQQRQAPAAPAPVTPSPVSAPRRLAESDSDSESSSGSDSE
ncbi:hypothetical protein HK104_002203 [Borealophlyctis nickersoniae]|nr:hypothetical protein HK104_002203 [Borealophlyctis nickersoniae]